MSNYTLDARNMLCPMPVIKTQDKINTLHKGDILDVIATDPGALVDIPAWCRISGHTVLETEDRKGEVLVRIKVGQL